MDGGINVTEQNFFKTEDGKWLYYETYGSGEPLILIPGHMCTTSFFSKNVQVLAGRYWVITYDPRGYGRSTKSTEGNTVRCHGRDIHELMEHLSVRRAAVFAWSLGGAALMSYIRDYGQKRLRAVGLIDTPLYPFSAEPWNSHRTKGYNIDGWLETYGGWVQDPEAYYRFFSNKQFRNPPSEEQQRWLVGEVRKTMPWTGLELHLDFCHQNFIPDLEQLEVPTAIFAGISVNLPKAVDMAKEYRKRLKYGARLYIFEEGGHLPFYVEADRFNGAVLEFLEEVENKKYE